ncbi:MAG: hypothetical protein JSU08_15255 [Acidobacteria bacterium]|nr:hypothetical protein [Acidobacteriota bacterium]
MSDPKFVGRGHRGRKMPPEQRERVAEGVRRWHREMSDEQRQSWLAGVSLSQMRFPGDTRLRGYKTTFVRGHPDMSTQAGLEKMRATKRGLPSVKRHMAQIAADHPELIRNALLRELDGPRAAQVLMLFAAYLDGKPGDGSSESPTRYDPKLAAMSTLELAAEAEKLAATLRAMADAEREKLPVIDVTPIESTDTDPDEVLL